MPPLRTICFHSARAGTGKSHIIANLAVTLAQRGLRVGIADLDFHAPGQDILFTLPEETLTPTVNMFLENQLLSYESAVEAVEAEVNTEVKAIAWQDCFRPVNEHLQPQKDLPTPLYLAPADRRKQFLKPVWDYGFDLDRLTERLKKQFSDHPLDYLLLDTAPGFRREALYLAVNAHLLFVTLTPNYQDIQNTATLLTVLQQKAPDPPPSNYLVLNKKFRNEHTADIRDDILTHLDLPLAAELPEERGIIARAGRGIYCLAAPNSEWCKGIRDLADLVQRELSL